MKNFKHLTLLLASLFMVALASCDKDDDDDVSPNVRLLTEGEWKVSAVYFNEEDITDEYNEQSNFDVTTYTSKFERDGTYIDKFDGQTHDGTWRFENNERIIIFDEGTADEYTVTVSKLDEDELFYLQNGVEFRFQR